jgi:hypothetical protein
VRHRALTRQRHAGYSRKSINLLLRDGWRS